MAKSLNIFKASLLAKALPGISTSIETEDYIHVCKVRDEQVKRTCLISYIWDTRDIVRVGLYYDETNEAIDALNALSNAEANELLADDNLTWLKIRNNEDLTFSDYIDFANCEIMTKPTLLKLTTSNETVHGEVIRKFMINGIDICMTKQFVDVIDGKGIKLMSTSYYRNNLEHIFGFRLDYNRPGKHTWYNVNFEDNLPDMSIKYKGAAITRTALKAKLMSLFNVQF